MSILIKAKGELAKNLIITTKGASHGASNKSRSLIFYGRDLNAVNSWLRMQKNKVILEDEAVHRFEGHYEKMSYGKSEKHDPMSFRHAGFGQNAVGAAANQDLAGGVAKGGMKLTRVLQSRSFIAYQGGRNGEDAGGPKLMHNQTDIKWVRTERRDPNEDRCLINVATGYLVLTEGAARRIIADPNASPGDKMLAKLEVYRRTGKPDW